jgi:hypothetical protein
MPQPSWRKISVVKVPAQPAQAALWTLVLDLLAGPRLLRFTAVDRDEQSNAVPLTWELAPGQAACPPNGIPGAQAVTYLAHGVPQGALIGKLGGSTADFPAGSPPVYSGARVFPVGGHTVVKLAADEIGPLYLTMNDSPGGFDKHAGHLHVLVEEMDL